MIVRGVSSDRASRPARSSSQRAKNSQSQGGIHACSTQVLTGFRLAWLTQHIDHHMREHSETWGHRRPNAPRPGNHRPALFLPR
jgi:hypothetical protein